MAASVAASEVSPPKERAVTFNRWLPYWAVLQADIQQTMRGWVYRLWVFVSFVAAAGYLAYRFGLTHEAGLIQPASKLMADLLRWTLLGSVSLIVVICAGAISSERGTMADSILSRGISRYQYFLGKLHSRLMTIVLTFWILSGIVLFASVCLLHEDLTWHGSVFALTAISFILMAIITCGITVSAMFNSTLLGLALLWIALYGGGFALTLLPESSTSPIRLMKNLPNMLQGHYDLQVLLYLGLWCATISIISALFGLFFFAQRDI